MSPDTVWMLSSIVSIVVAIPGGIIGWYKLGKPWLARRKKDRETQQAIRELLLGKDAEPANAITGELAVKEVPALGTRMANMEAAITQLADVHNILAKHDQRITELEKARVERLVTQAESAHMWRAVADEKLGLDEPPEIP